MSTWPTFLPKPTGAFSGDVQARGRRVHMESGRYRQRLLYTTGVRFFNAFWEMSDWQFGMFQSWVKHELNNGADEFQVELPTGYGTFELVTATLVGGNYQGRHYGFLRYRVRARLEVYDA